MNCNFSISATTSNTIQLLIHGSSKNVQFRLGSNLTTHFKHHVQYQMRFVLILSLSLSVLYASMISAL